MAQTTGSVQRLKWLSGIGRLFVYLRAGPTTELFYLPFDSASAIGRAGARAMSITLARASNSGLPVVLTHGANDSQVTVVDLRAPAVRLSGFEITQSIQDPAHAVALIAGKRTVVRVILESAAPATQTVTGQLRVRRAGHADRVVLPAGPATLDASDFGSPATIRGSAGKTLNFVLPDELVVVGSIEVSFEGLADATGNRVPFAGGGLTRSATFVPGTPLRIVIVGFTYTFGSPPQTFTPSQLDFDRVLSWLRRAYPASEVVGAQRVVTATSAPAFSCGQINSELAQIRALDVAGGTDARTHYYGLVSDGGFFMRGCAAVPSSPNPAAVGSGPTGPASWGWDTDGSYGDWYGGHEIGHTFGRRHPGFCGETHDDPSYPYALGQLADTTDSFVGFDVGDAAAGLGLSALPGTTWHDVMTYCPQEWLSAYTYDGIRMRLAAEDALAPGAAAPGGGRRDDRYAAFVSKSEEREARPVRHLEVVATVALGPGTGRLTAIIPATVSRARGRVSAESTVQLRVVGVRNEIVSTFKAEAMPLSDLDEGAGIDALLSEVIPIEAGATAVQLVIRERVVDEAPLNVTVDAIQGLEIAETADGWLEVAWEAREERVGLASDALQLSLDDGRSWKTVAVGVRNGRARVHPSNLPPTGRVLVRVISLSGGGWSSGVAQFDRGERPGPNH